MVRDVSVFFSPLIKRIPEYTERRLLISYFLLYDSFDLRFLVGISGQENSNKINPLTTATFFALAIQYIIIYIYI